MVYVIYKASRSPTNESYMGPAWDAAGIRHLYQSTYEDRATAERLAAQLEEVNPVGFRVSAVDL